PGPWRRPWSSGAGGLRRRVATAERRDSTTNASSVGGPIAILSSARGGRRGARHWHESRPKPDDPLRARMVPDALHANPIQTLPRRNEQRSLIRPLAKLHIRRGLRRRDKGQLLSRRRADMDPRSRPCRNGARDRWEN